jgi:hypothetical protein
MKVGSHYYEIMLLIKNKKPVSFETGFLIIEKINYASTSNGSIET